MDETIQEHLEESARECAKDDLTRFLEIREEVRTVFAPVRAMIASDTDGNLDKDEFHLAALAGLNAHALRDGQITDREREYIREASRNLNTAYSNFIYDNVGPQAEFAPSAFALQFVARMTSDDSVLSMAEQSKRANCGIPV